MPIERLLSPRVGSGHKIEQLSPVEYRIWTIYLLAADDYGVMPLMASKIQGADRWCSKRSGLTIVRALERAIAVKLLRRFEVNGDIFVCSTNWQEHQHIRRPRKTYYPVPPAELLAECEPETRAFFASRTSAEILPEHSGNISESPPEDFGNISGLAREQQQQQEHSAVATASAGEGSGEGPPPLDHWFRQLCLLYPPQAVSIGHLTEHAFCETFAKDPRDALLVWSDILEGLNNQKRGYQWRVKTMIPKLERWLSEGLWKQRHDEHPPPMTVGERTARTLTSAQQFIADGDRGPR